MAPIDVAGVKSDNRFVVEEGTELGWNGIIYNVGAGEKAKNPMGTDPRVREAFELSIDRDGLVQAMSKGQYTPGNQWVSPSNAYYVKEMPVPKRDIAKAKALLAAAGQPHPVITLVTPTQSETMLFAQIIQAMTREAGFDMKIQATEFATALDITQKGDFEMFTYFWSGRTDPDGNIYNFTACGAPLNIGKYCNPDVDVALKAARQTADPDSRRKSLGAGCSHHPQGPPDAVCLSPQVFLGTAGGAEELRRLSRWAGSLHQPEAQLRSPPCCVSCSSDWP